MSDIKNWSTTASENNKTPPNGWPENMAPSEVNDTARENMAAAKRAYIQQPYFSPGSSPVYVDGSTVTIADNELYTDYSKFFLAGRRVLITASSGDKYGVVSSSSYSSGSTKVKIMVDGEGSIPTDMTDILLGLSTNDVEGVAGPNLLGFVLPYTADYDNVPTGFGLADGDFFDPTIYSALADLYDTGEVDESGNKLYIHGQGYNNGVWMPKKPDVRGLFPRFLDYRTEDKVDPDSPREVGSVQEDKAGPHTHSFLVNTENGYIRATESSYLGSAIYAASSNREMWHEKTNLSNLKSVGEETGCTETRPSNMALPGLLVMYGGYTSATGIKVEDLLTLTVAEAQKQIDALEVEVNEAISLLDVKTEEKVAELTAIISVAETDIDASVALAKQYADQAATVTVGKQDKLVSGQYEVLTTYWSEQSGSGDTWYKASIPISGVVPDSIAWVSPTPSQENVDTWSSNGVYCYEIGTGVLNLRASSIPDVSLFVSYIVTNLQGV